MGIRSWLQADEIRSRRPWWTAANTVAQSRLLETWPTNVGGASRLAMQVPTAVRCVELLSTQIAQFPAEAWRDDVRLETQPRVLRRPDPFSTYFRFTVDTVTDMLFEGTAAWLITARDEQTGRAIALQHLPACELEIRWEPSLPQAQARLENRRQIKYGGQLVDPEQVILVPMILPPGEARGVGPVQAGQAICQGQVAADDLVRSNFNDGAFPSGSINVPTNLSQEQADRVKSSFMESAAGSRAPVVLSGGAEFKPHAVTARDAQWIEARQWGASEIARLFGVPPAMLNIPIQGGSQVTYNNAVSVRTDLLHTGLGPINARLENAWSQVVPLTQQVHLDTTRYLPPLEAITPSSADPNSPPTDTPATPTAGQEPTEGNTAVV